MQLLKYALKKSLLLLLELHQMGLSSDPKILEIVDVLLSTVVQVTQLCHQDSLCTSQNDFSNAAYSLCAAHAFTTYFSSTYVHKVSLNQTVVTHLENKKMRCNKINKSLKMITTIAFVRRSRVHVVRFMRSELRATNDTLQHFSAILVSFYTRLIALL